MLAQNWEKGCYALWVWLVWWKESSNQIWMETFLVKTFSMLAMHACMYACWSGAFLILSPQELLNHSFVVSVEAFLSLAPAMSLGAISDLCKRLEEDVQDSGASVCRSHHRWLFKKLEEPKSDASSKWVFLDMILVGIDVFGKHVCQWQCTFIAITVLAWFVLFEVTLLMDLHYAVVIVGSSSTSFEVTRGGSSTKWRRVKGASSDLRVHGT